MKRQRSRPQPQKEARMRLRDWRKLLLPVIVSAGLAARPFVAMASACGNGIIEPEEQCDDGNTLGADGCSAACTVERNYTCTGQPSVCTLKPGASGSTECQPDSDSASLTALENALAGIEEWPTMKAKAVSLGMNVQDFTNRLACHEGGPTTHWLVFLPGAVPGCTPYPSLREFGGRFNRRRAALG